MVCSVHGASPTPLSHSHREMTWPVEDPDNLNAQLQSRTPVRGHVPMEEREARANRFVSLVVGHTGNDKLPKLISRQRR